jgi:polyhydroxyalkanoate synthesis regulator phasin
LRLPSPRDVVGQSRARPLNAATRRSTPYAQRDADREAEVASLRSRITELERRLSQLEMENAQLRSRDYSLQLA